MTGGRAEVRVRDVVMRYRRSGTGARTVLLLVSADPTHELWPELDGALARRFRVIVPELPPAGRDVAGWLAGFLEGLGARDIAVIAADAWCLSAVELVLLDVELVSRVVLVAAGEAADTGLDGSLSTSVRSAPVPMLVLRRGLSTADAVSTILRFADAGPAS